MQPAEKHTHTHACQIKAAGSNTNGRLFLPLNCECEGGHMSECTCISIVCFVKCVQRVSLKKKWTIFSSGGQNGKKKIYEWISLRSRSHFAPWLLVFSVFCFVYASRSGNETQPTYLTRAFKGNASAVSRWFQNTTLGFTLYVWIWLDKLGGGDTLMVDMTRHIKALL